MDANRNADVPPPQLDGELRFDQEARDAAADDFGHIVHRTPEAVLAPGSANDVVKTLKWTAQRGGRFAAQGQRHSVWGRSEAENGVVADMSTLNAVGGVEGDRITVDAGAKWSEVLAATLPQGKTPPVLCEYLELSVGGTIVVGGVGGTTSTYGVQADNVVSMDVVTGDGDEVNCSATSHPDLFDAVRSGLGQVGVITRATLELVDAPEQVRRYLLFYPDLATMLADARLLSTSEDTRFEAVQGAIMPPPTGGWAYRLDCAKYFTGDPPDDATLLAGLSDVPDKRQPATMSYFDYLNRLSMLEGALRGNGQWFFPHPWLTTFIGDSKVDAVVADELARVNAPTDLGQFGQIVLSPLKRSTMTSPLLRTPSDDLMYAFNFVRVPTTDDLANADRLVEANKGVYERVRAAGGVLYPVSAIPMSRDDWRGHFGTAYGLLEAAKHKYDPGNVLTPGYEVF
jgi:FAD/FMN-containing dehydrogenase